MENRNTMKTWHVCSISHMTCILQRVFIIRLSQRTLNFPLRLSWTNLEYQAVINTKLESFSWKAYWGWIFVKRGAGVYLPIFALAPCIYAAFRHTILFLRPELEGEDIPWAEASGMWIFNPLVSRVLLKNKGQRCCTHTITSSRVCDEKSSFAEKQ